MNDAAKKFCKAHQFPEPTAVNEKMFSVVIHFTGGGWIKVSKQMLEQYTTKE